MPPELRGAPSFAAFLAFVGLAAGAVAWRRRRAAVDVVVGTAAWSAALVVGLVTALSLVRMLAPLPLLCAAGLAALVAVSWRAATRRAPFDREPVEPPSRVPSAGTWWVGLGLAPVALFAALTIRTMGTTPEAGADSLAYHLPRLGYWAQDGVAPFVAANARAGSFPPNGNALQLPFVLFLRDDRWCGLVQLGAALAIGAAVYGIARGWRASRLGASLGALCGLALPCLLEQAAWTAVDVTASFFVVAAAFFLVREPSGAYGGVGALACAALAIGTKTPTAVLVLPLAAAALWRLARGHRRALAAVLILGPFASLALGGAFFAGNVRRWSDPFGPASIRWVVVHPSTASLAKNLALVADPVLSLPSRTSVDGIWRAAGDSFTFRGLGLGWILMTAAAGIALGLSLRRGRREGWNGPLGTWTLGVGGLLVLCFALRHQPAVLRFVLPAAVLVAPTFALAFDHFAGHGPRRVLVTAIVWAGVGLTTWRAHGNERAKRLREDRGPAWTRRFEPDLRPLAAAVERLGRPDAPPRLALVTPDYFPERVFFGPDYRVHLLNLSYDPPRDASALRALEVEALWLDTQAGCSLALFQRTFDRPAPRPERNWRARPDGYDEDFAQAYGESLSRTDLRPTVQALAESDPGWHVALRSARGVLFARGDGPPIDVREICGGP